MADINRFLSSGSTVLRGIGYGCVCAVVLLSPWCFGAWEMWWFWPMAAILFLGAFCAGLGTLFQSAFLAADTAPPPGEDARLRFEGRLAALLLCVLPFLLFAFWRATQPSGPGAPLVEMEAERSLLLFSTPVLLALTLFLSATRRRLRWLAAMLLGNAVVVAVYAAANHWITRDVYVLWVRTPFNYGPRAGGVFFCPNHLAAYLNIALCMVIAVLLVRTARWTLRLVALALALPLLVGWFLTLSRGGTASLVLTFPVLLLAGLRGYPWKARLATALLLLVAVAGMVGAALTVENPLLERIRSHPLTKSVLKVPETGWAPVKRTFFRHFDRGMYIDSALRAWRSNPVVGIGPGQHAMRWPEFAATEDGDRASAKWPTLTNHGYFLYEVHSDWVQLLEEFGIIGFALFLIPALAVPVVLLRAQGAGLRRDSEPLDQALPLASLLALSAFAVHSLGDFSLHIPAIVWNLTALVCCGLLITLPARGEAGYSSRSRNETAD